MMAVHACGLNANNQILSGGPPLLCCPTAIRTIQNVKDVQIALSHILWKTDTGWQMTGYDSNNDSLALDNTQDWKISVSEMRIAAVDPNGSVLLREKRFWRELYFQKDTENSISLPTEARTLDSTKEKEDQKTHDVTKEMENEAGNRSKVKFTSICVEDNSLIALDNDGRVFSSGVPLPLGGYKISDIHLGKDHCIALTTDGVVLTWGSGMRGQLGNGELCQVEHPEPVETLQGIVIISLACGGWHSIALSTTGDVYVWGWNESGQLGFPAKSTSDTTILGKFSYSCQCPKSWSKETESIGKNKTGLDDSETNYPEQVKNCNADTRINLSHTKDIVNVQASPKLLDFWNEDIIIKQVSCGDRHTAFQLDDGSIWTCGMNKYGQLGLGDTIDRYEPCLVPVKNVSDIYTGGWISIFITSKT